MAGTPIWTQRITAGVSEFFTVTNPPMTIQVNGLLAHEKVHVRSSDQGDTGAFHPFRSGGNVQLDYNNTEINIYTKGRYCLELEVEPKNPIDAQRIE